MKVAACHVRIWLLFFCIIIITFPYCKYPQTNKVDTFVECMIACVWSSSESFSSSQYLHFHDITVKETSEQQIYSPFKPIEHYTLLTFSIFVFSIVRKQQHEKKSETFIRFRANNNNKRAKQRALQTTDDDDELQKNTKIYSKKIISEITFSFRASIKKAANVPNTLTISNPLVSFCVLLF